MNKIFLFIILLFSYSFSQNFDPNTGVSDNHQFDPETGEKIDDSTNSILYLNSFSVKNQKSEDHFTLSDFEDIYNTETLYPSPPWFGSSITSKHYKAKKGAYLLNNLEIREEIRRYPQSRSVLDDYTKWKRLSFISLGMALAGPIFFSSVEVGMLHILSFYSGIGFSIYCSNQFTKHWYKAIWIYNRENIRSQLKNAGY
jgi:hypothetical protein